MLLNALLSPHVYSTSTFTYILWSSELIGDKILQTSFHDAIPTAPSTSTITI